MAKVSILGGGTVFHVRPHLALAAPAYGGTARRLARLVAEDPTFADHDVELALTRMADARSTIETNEHVRAWLDERVADPRCKVVFLPAAICDYEASVLEGAERTPSGLDAARLATADGSRRIELTPAEKLVRELRRDRKDLFVVAFKVTAGATAEAQYLSGLQLLKTASVNLVLANDLHTRRNMVITPEQARYHETTNRDEALRGLVEMAGLRSRGTYTRSTVVGGERVAWRSRDVAPSLVAVVDHCVARGAYKPFLGATVGHFAARSGDGSFLTSIRKTDFNRLDDVGVVRIEARDDDRVLAHGARPSVGGQSQRLVLRAHPDLDYILHFHCPMRAGAGVVVREQRPYECGSHECGRNTSEGLARVAEGIWAVMLDRHGPNIVFRRDVDPEQVISFIESSFDLTGRTDGVAVATGVA